MSNKVILWQKQKDGAKNSKIKGTGKTKMLSSLKEENGFLTSHF